jgi:hypothetical protein
MGLGLLVGVLVCVGLRSADKRAVVRSCVCCFC